MIQWQLGNSWCWCLGGVGVGVDADIDIAILSLGSVRMFGGGAPLLGR